MTVDFEQYFGDAKVLAQKVLEIQYENLRPTFPVDPFKLLKSFGVIYQFRDFDGLEGVYIVPESEKDIPIVGINVNRRITRQRFTAAHELCHHLKDKNSIACPIGKRDIEPLNYIEKFANKFASELLMPSKYLAEVINVYKKGKYVSFEDVIFIADYFGVSFRACINRLAWEFNVIDGDTKNKDIKRRIAKFQPENKRIEYGLKDYNINMLANIINSNSYFFVQDNHHTWLRFKNDFIFNENRIEGIGLSKETVSEIVTDLRFHKNFSRYCNEKHQDIIEVCGHASLYDYIFETSDKITSYKMVQLHRMLYQYSPYPENAGKTRTNNNYVLGAKFETVDHSEIMSKLVNLDIVLQRLISKINDLSFIDYIDKVLEIHYEITYIHPFHDGNGRISRIMINWLFKLKGLPPIYINSNRKEEYFAALATIDEFGDYDNLKKIIYKSILESLYKLNSKFMI